MDNSLMIEYLKVLKELFSTNTYKANGNLLRDIKYHMLDNKDDEHIKNIRKIFANRLNEIFNDKELNNAFNLSDDFKYHKIIEIFKNDPFRTKQKYIELFQYTIFIPEGDHLENNVKWFLNDTGFYSTANLDKLLEFHSKYRNLGGTDLYGTFEEERKKYLEAYNNIETEDYLNFVKEKNLEAGSFNRYYDNMNAPIDYMNKRLGNMGEIYLYETLVKEKETTFVARDLGNGFGYDIYTTTMMDNMKKELLIEVKSTTCKDKDYFALTETEHKTMVDSLDNPKAEYVVCTSYIDVINNEIKNRYYKAIDENTFKDLYSNDEYMFTNFDKNGNAVFEQKVKTKR